MRVSFGKDEVTEKKYAEFWEPKDGKPKDYVRIYEDGKIIFHRQGIETADMTKWQDWNPLDRLQEAMRRGMTR